MRARAYIRVAEISLAARLSCELTFTRETAGSPPSGGRGNSAVAGNRVSVNLLSINPQTHMEYRQRMYATYEDSVLSAQLLQYTTMVVSISPFSNPAIPSGPFTYAHYSDYARSSSRCSSCNCGIQYSPCSYRTNGNPRSPLDSSLETSLATIPGWKDEDSQL